MRRILHASILITSLLLGTLGSSAQTLAAPAPPFAVVTVPRLNVRAAPSTNAPVLGQVSSDERVTVLGRNGEGTWLRVESTTGVSGWIFAEMAQPSVPITALSVSSPPAHPSPMGQPPGVTPAPAADIATPAATTNQPVSYAPEQAQSTASSSQPAPAQSNAPAPAATMAQRPAPNADPQPVQPGIQAPETAVGSEEATTPAGAVQLQPLCLPNKLRTVSLGGRPQAVAVLGDRLYVTLAELNSLMVVDAGMDVMLGSSRTTAREIGAIAAGPDSLYVVDKEDNRLIVTSRQGAVREEIDLPAEPGPVAVTEGRAFVLHPQMGALSVVDLNSQETIATLSIGSDPRQIAVIAGRAFVGHAAGFLSVVDGFGRRREQLHLPVNDVVGMAADPQTAMLYIASAGDQKVVAVDTNTWTLANTWELDMMPSSLAYNDVTRHLFVLDRTSQYLTVLNTAKPEQVGQVQVSKQPARDGGNSLALLQSKLYIMHPANDYLAVWLDRTCDDSGQPSTGVLAASFSRKDLAPRRIEARIGILWPHGNADPAQASFANMTATLIREDGASPACGWKPTVTLWAAVGSEPARQVAVGQQRMATEENVAFPVYDFNDVDVRATREKRVPIHFTVRVEGVETAMNVWTHSGTGQYLPTVRPELEGLVTRHEGALDARLWVEKEGGGLAVFGLLMRPGTMLGLAPSAVPATPQLRWALDNGVTEPELIVGQPETRQGDGFIYTVWRFPGLNPDDYLRNAAQVRFWIEIPDVQVNSSVLAWGKDIRTLGARLPIPVVGCQEEIASSR